MAAGLTRLAFVIGLIVNRPVPTRPLRHYH